MSELRDLTLALRSFDNRFTTIEECLVVLVRNSEQETEWRHSQRNIAHISSILQEEHGNSIKKVQEFQGALWNYLSTLEERLSTLAIVRVDDAKAVNRRIGKIERKIDDDEVTQT